MATMINVEDITAGGVYFFRAENRFSEIGKPFELLGVVTSVTDNNVTADDGKWISGIVLKRFDGPIAVSTFEFSSAKTEIYPIENLKISFDIVERKHYDI